MRGSGFFGHGFASGKARGGCSFRRNSRWWRRRHHVSECLGGFPSATTLRQEIRVRALGGGEGGGLTAFTSGAWTVATGFLRRGMRDRTLGRGEGGGLTASLRAGTVATGFLRQEIRARALGGGESGGATASTSGARTAATGSAPGNPRSHLGWRRRWRLDSLHFGGLDCGDKLLAPGNPRSHLGWRRRWRLDSFEFGGLGLWRPVCAGKFARAFWL